MSKRRRFIFTSVILSLGFIGVQLLQDQFRFASIGTLGLLTLILFYWSLREGLEFNLTLLTLVLPLFFTVGVGLFWFLLPSNIFARIPIVIFYGLGVYALCLTANIYTVATIRTIALLRAARGVGFVLTLITFFLVYDTILSLRLSLMLNFFFVLLVTIPLFLQGYWMIILEKKISYEVSIASVVSSLLLAEISIALFFWPVTVVVGSLFLTTAAYILLGLVQAKLDGRIFQQTVREYLLVGAIVFIGMFISTRWGG